MAEIGRPEATSRFGILWGGGLGDLLVVRPLIRALVRDVGLRPVFMTTASHLPEIFAELCEGAERPRLSRRLPDAAQFAWRERKRFDFLYLGPYPTWRTRLLAGALAPGRVIGGRHEGASPFMLDQILEDARDLSGRAISLEEAFRDALPRNVPGRELSITEIDRPYLVLHPGAKAGWETTRWSHENWQGLLFKILHETPYDVLLVGVRSEAPALKSMRDLVSARFTGRMKTLISAPLADLASIIASSSGVVCHNSGILHLATLLKTNIVCLTGSSALYWRPPYPWVTNVTSGRCNLACNSYRCPAPLLGAACIRKLTIEKVWGTVRERLLR